MEIQGLYAAMCVSHLTDATAFYARVLGREPDDRPMDTLVQWRGYGRAGIQLFEDAARAGHGRMTLVVPDLAVVQSQLSAAGIALGDVQQGDFGKIAQLVDPDGNLVTLAEPLRASAGAG